MNEIKSGCRCSYNLLVLLIFGLICLPLALAQSGEIKGKILPSDSNATIYVISPTQEVAGNQTIGINGEYSFILQIGIYDLFIRARRDYNNKTIFQIGIRDNETTEVQDIILSRVNETGSISGYVNPPIEGLKVEVRKFGGGGSSFSITSTDGYYEVKDLEPDTYGIFVRFNSTQNFYSYKWGMIDIYANSNLTGINLTFTPKTYKYLIDRIIVEFQPEFSEGEKRDIINSYNSRVISHYSYSRHYVVSVPPDKTPEDMVQIFENDTRVEDASLDRILSVRSGTDIIEETQNEEESVSTEEVKEKTKLIRAIVEEIESSNNNLEITKPSIESDITDRDLDISKKSNKTYITLLLTLIIIIFLTTYSIIKWKKRV